MVALGIGIADVRPTDSEDLFQHCPVLKRRPTQLCPVSPLAASDHVVNPGESQLLMSKMTMQHGSSLSRLFRHVKDSDKRRGLGVTFLDADSTKVEFAMRCRDFPKGTPWRNRPR